MSIIFKKLNLKDVIKTPFKSYKEWSFNSSSFSSNGISFNSCTYDSGSVDTFSSESIKYYQLDSLFYRNHIDNTKERILDESVNIISLPYKKIGLRIKPGSVVLTSASIEYKDDKNGNLYDSTFDTSSFVSNDQRIFYVGNAYKFKKYASSSNFSYTHPSSSDDSIYHNSLEFYNVQFTRGIYGSKLDFGTNTYLKSKNTEFFNFASDEDFAWSFYLTVPSSSTSRQYILVKGVTKESPFLPVSTTVYGGSYQAPSEVQYPYAVYYEGTTLYFEQNDGKTTRTISTPIQTGSAIHVLCQQSSSQAQIWISGNLIVSSSTSLGNIENSADLFIGQKGDNTAFFSGSMEHIALYDTSFNTQGTQLLSASIDNSPNVGNVFYEQGFITITKPGYQTLMTSSLVENTDWTLNYKSTVIITENEYLCTVKKDEFNYTMNPSARKSGRLYDDTVANFATGSYFSPYVTTVGLYNEDDELLAVGKMGQSIRMSDKTDTTFIIRFDT